MRLIFMGTPEFAIPSLKILLDQGCDVAAVVTVPDKRSGRGQRLSPPPVKVFARERNLPVLQPENLRDPSFVGELRSLGADLAVVVAFRILPPEVFTLPKFGSFNLHASLLPKYRGAAPIQWAIMRGERETGVTTFFLNAAVDTGGIILQARVPIGEEDTAGDLHDRLAEVGAEIVLHTVRLIENGKAAPKQQDESAASPAPKLFKEDCAVNWGAGAEEVHNFIRALSPKPCAYTVHRRAMLNIYRSRVAPGAAAEAPGTVLDADRRLVVGTQRGAVEILELQLEGKKRLSAQEFLRGYGLAKGEVLPS
jgi:methionyl-tRNA formyltransferase